MTGIRLFAILFLQSEGCQVDLNALLQSMTMKEKIGQLTQYNANLFVDTTAVEVVLICITSFIGIFAVSAALEGYLMHHMPWYLRLISAVGGLLLIYPGLITDSIGVVLVGVMVAGQFFTAKKASATA